MAKRKNAPMAGGCLLCISLLAGALIGVFAGQASIGVLTGFGVGLVLVALIWAVDRKRRR